ncbi:MAG: glycosyltransferase family 1 protein [Candidatus Omnitrophota bacterium]
MKIGFDARMITHPGIGRYIKGLIPELIRQAPRDEFVIFGDPQHLTCIPKKDNVTVIKWTASVYSLSEQFPPYDKYGLDILHIPHFNIPVFCKTKMVVTIHDLIYLLLPEAASSPIAKFYAKFMIGQSLNKAHKIISISQNTKDDIVSVFGSKNADKIEVIPEAAVDKFKVIEDKDRIRGMSDKYGLSDKVILYVGSIKRHKNVGTLIEVYNILKKKGISHQLVITGRWDKKEDDLRKSINDKDIRYIGEIPTEDLMLLYNHADILLHLSMYEGFGLTTLEAMRCGTPVVTSGTSSLPEVCGDAALYVNPLDIGQIVDTVYNVVSNSNIKKGLIERGFEQANRFSWEKTAGRTLETYHKA